MDLLLLFGATWCAVTPSLRYEAVSDADATSKSLIGRFAESLEDNEISFRLSRYVQLEAAYIRGVTPLVDFPLSPKPLSKVR